MQDLEILKTLDPSLADPRDAVLGSIWKNLCENISVDTDETSTILKGCISMAYIAGRMRERKAFSMWRILGGGDVRETGEDS